MSQVFRTESRTKEFTARPHEDGSVEILIEDRHGYGQESARYELTASEAAALSAYLTTTLGGAA